MVSVNGIISAKDKNSPLLQTNECSSAFYVQAAMLAFPALLERLFPVVE